VKVIDVIKNANVLLRNSDTAKIDIKVLLSFFLKRDLNEMFKYYNIDIDENKFNILLERRNNNEPIANIINKKGFWNDVFFVNANVLTPRSDSETIIEAIINNYKNKDEKLNILDLGVGSGCLLLSLLKIYKNANGVGVDISEKALNIAKKNSKLLKINNVKFLKSNWNDKINEKFDIIISNPPYIETDFINKLSKEVNIYNPLIALDGGKDGLDCYRYLAQNLQKNIKKKTSIFFEIGYKQAKNINKILIENNYKIKKIYKDYNKIERVIYIKYKTKN
jgi:release factor glutamine methyltransferase